MKPEFGFTTQSLSMFMSINIDFGFISQPNSAFNFVNIEIGFDRVEEDGPLIELFPVAELLPKTEYVRDAELKSGSGESSQVGFHTWTDRVGDASASPEISELEASWTDGVLTVSSPGGALR